MLNILQKELLTKVKNLKMLDFFKDLDGFTLMPVANYLEVKNYRLGDVVLKEGDYPKYFYIIT